MLQTFESCLICSATHKDHLMPSQTKDIIMVYTIYNKAFEKVVMFQNRSTLGSLHG